MLPAWQLTNSSVSQLKDLPTELLIHKMSPHSHPGYVRDEAWRQLGQNARSSLPSPEPWSGSEHVLYLICDLIIPGFQDAGSVFSSPQCRCCGCCSSFSWRQCIHWPDRHSYSNNWDIDIGPSLGSEPCYIYRPVLLAGWGWRPLAPWSCPWCGPASFSPAVSCC